LNNGGGDAVEGGEVRMVEAAGLILLMYTKVGVPWNRVVRALPGWQDSPGQNDTMMPIRLLQYIEVISSFIVSPLDFQ
jgi:hypothetical protein